MIICEVLILSLIVMVQGNVTLRGGLDIVRKDFRPQGTRGKFANGLRAVVVALAAASGSYLYRHHDDIDNFLLIVLLSGVLLLGLELTLFLALDICIGLRRRRWRSEHLDEVAIESLLAIRYEVTDARREAWGTRPVIARLERELESLAANIDRWLPLRLGGGASEHKRELRARARGIAASCRAQKRALATMNGREELAAFTATWIQAIGRRAWFDVPASITIAPGVSPARRLRSIVGAVLPIVVFAAAQAIGVIDGAAATYCIIGSLIWFANSVMLWVDPDYPTRLATMTSVRRLLHRDDTAGMTPQNDSNASRKDALE
jgi:hypothetical protein